MKPVFLKACKMKKGIIFCLLCFIAYTPISAQVIYAKEDVLFDVGNQRILVKLGGSAALLDLEGNDIISHYKNYADVKVQNHVIWVSNGFNYALFDLWGNQKTGFVYPLVGDMSDNWCSIQLKNEKWTLVDTNGIVYDTAGFEYIYPPVGDDVVFLKDKKWGVMSLSNKSILLAPRSKPLKKFVFNFLPFKDDNNLWGLMNEQFEVILQPEYQSIFVLTNNRIAASQNGKFALINESGKALSPYNYSLISELNNEYFKVSNNGQLGVINKEGELLVQIGYSSIAVSNVGFVCEQGGSYELLSFSGKSILKTKEPIKVVNSLAVIETHAGFYDVLNDKGKRTFNADFIHVNTSSDGFIYCLSVDKLYKYNLNFKEVASQPAIGKKVYLFDNIPYVYDDIRVYLINNQAQELKNYDAFDTYDFNNNFAILRGFMGYGIINNEGDFITTPYNFSVTGLSENRAAVMPYEKAPAQIIDAKGKLIFTAADDYQYVGPYFEGLAQIVFKADNSVGFVDVNGHVKIRGIQSKNVGYFSNGLCSVQNEYHYYGYIDDKGNMLIPQNYKIAYPFGENGLALVADQNGKFGFIDKKGMVVIPFDYDNAFSFYEGYAPVVKNNKSGVIDEKNNLVIPPIYHDLKYPSQNRVAVMLNGLWYFVDMNNNRIGTLEFNDANPFAEGRAWVKNGELWGAIDLDGNLVIDFKYKKPSDFKEGIAVAETIDGVRLIDPNDQIIQKDCSCIFGSFNNGVALKKENKNFQAYPFNQ